MDWISQIGTSGILTCILTCIIIGIIGIIISSIIIGIGIGISTPVVTTTIVTTNIATIVIETNEWINTIISGTINWNTIKEGCINWNTVNESRTIWSIIKEGTEAIKNNWFRSGGSVGLWCRCAIILHHRLEIVLFYAVVWGWQTCILRLGVDSGTRWLSCFQLTSVWGRQLRDLRALSR